MRATVGAKCYCLSSRRCNALIASLIACSMVRPAKGNSGQNHSPDVPNQLTKFSHEALWLLTGVENRWPCSGAAVPDKFQKRTRHWEHDCSARTDQHGKPHRLRGVVDEHDPVRSLDRKPHQQNDRQTGRPCLRYTEDSATAAKPRLRQAIVGNRVVGFSGSPRSPPRRAPDQVDPPRMTAAQLRM